ncbi:MAG: glycosyltransferase [Bacillota bacterium]|nr:glycosyltransferase [Bacillota bacterium]
MRQHLLTLVTGLVAQGVAVEAAGPAGEPLLEELAGWGCKVHDLPLSASLRPVEDLRAAARLSLLLRRRRFDLVHVHGFKASLPGRVAAALFGTPVVYTVHNFVLEAAGGFRRRLYLWCERALAPLTTRYIAVSEALRRDLDARARIAPGRISVVYNGVPPHSPAPPGALAALRQELGLSDEVRVILCVARLVPEKGVDVLLRAVAALREASRVGDPLPPFRLLVAGEGPRGETLRMLAGQLGLEDQVAFLGHRPDVPALLDLADVVALPSRAEGLSLFLVEALVAGRPVVAARAGGIAEVVEDGKSGLLVPVEDPLALAAAVRRLLTDRSLATRLGEGARERGSRFSVDNMLRQTLAVYEASVRRTQ